ncbi:alpha/beta hydrolase [Enterococcus rivorum]|uniref:Carboxymethylenebutenolidase n=1 Tax=Enterococcus rivorum TaxID=762845 RepID=A0A1E5KXW7_9ENTE|nr:alpha/beta hydrolase [Enterococcus rivorum]MBP2099669.1 dienelactone hydrolase [Enterococcus rivorum]OEH82695.1 carboxymethylenebutenolidase [Enterococcus rivorum]
MSKTKKWKRIALISLLGLISIVVIALIYLKSVTYTPTTEALNAAKQATYKGNTLVFKGNPKKVSVIFYQGAFVDNASYSIWANKVAEAGFTVYLTKQPLNLAVLGGNKAQTIIDSEKLSSYVIGGHSLGGVMASRFAAENQESSALKGVFFLASYPDEKGSLKEFGGSVLSIVGSKDGVLNWAAFDKSKQYLPTQTNFQTIQGGNHAGFGSYGDQKGDQKAKITNQEQQDEVVKILIEWLQKI